MKIKIPGVLDYIIHELAENGGQITGTTKLCEMIPATRRGSQYSLKHANKYGLIRKSKSGRPGRGHKSTWSLTRKGWQYAKS
jgi:hypothetical protein